MDKYLISMKMIVPLPEFAQVGVDMSFVFCTESAANVIKGYSPDLIVLPIVPETPLFSDVSHMLLHKNSKILT